ncbi:MAG: hypothetical protein R3A47_01930 [Polyangiales bacterium]
MAPKRVDLINAHGTATPANDVVESRVLRNVFGDHRVKVTSIKSMIGHCMGAASAIEAVSCVLKHRTCGDSADDGPTEKGSIPNAMWMSWPTNPEAMRCDVVVNNACVWWLRRGCVFRRARCFDENVGMPV